MKFMCITEIRIISADFIYDLIYVFFSYQRFKSWLMLKRKKHIEAKFD